MVKVADCFLMLFLYHSFADVFVIRLAKAGGKEKENQRYRKRNATLQNHRPCWADSRICGF
jgi:hypothetical protein